VRGEDILKGLDSPFKGREDKILLEFVCLSIFSSSVGNGSTNLSYINDICKITMHNTKNYFSTNYSTYV
jgi:hypothetical protein